MYLYLNLRKFIGLLHYFYFYFYFYFVLA